MKEGEFPLPHSKKARMKGGSEETGEERSQKPQPKIGFLTRPAIPVLKEIGFVREAGFSWVLGRATNPTCCPGERNVGKL
jgi:hypothetical protein